MKGEYGYPEEVQDVLIGEALERSTDCCADALRAVRQLESRIDRLDERRTRARASSKLLTRTPVAPTRAKKRRSPNRKARKHPGIWQSGPKKGLLKPGCKYAKGGKIVCKKKRKR